MTRVIKPGDGGGWIAASELGRSEFRFSKLEIVTAETQKTNETLLLCYSPIS